MDNLPAHKVTGIREAIEGVGATVIYLSPYSPDFSPIENCWSKVKEFLRALFGANLCTVRPSNHRCSCCGHFPRYYRLVHPLLLLCFTQLRTAVSLAALQSYKFIALEKVLSSCGGCGTQLTAERVRF